MYYTYIYLLNKCWAILAQVLQRYHGEDVEAPEALDLMEAEKWMRNGSFKKRTAVLDNDNDT